MPLGPFGNPCWCDPVHGRDYMSFIGAWTGICAYNWRDIISILGGALNIFFWLILSIPQYRKMFRSKSSDGISIVMLLLWTVADILGLAGLIISGITSGTLLWLTIFFTVNNTIACSIWLYYDRIYPKLHKKAENHDGYTLMSDGDDDDDNVGLLSGTKGKSDGHDVYDGSKPRGHKGDLSYMGSNVDTTPAFNTLKISDEDILDTPIAIPSVNADVSINAQYTNQGGSSSSQDRLPSVGRNQTSRSSGHYQTRLLDPTTLSFIIAMFAVSSLQIVDAKSIVESAQLALDQAIDNVAEYAQYVQYLVTNNPDKLPYCVKTTLPSTTKRIIGFSMTAICAFMNSVSRIPQVRLNAKRKTTAGLSLTFTLYQLTANFFFFISRFFPTTLEFTMHWFETSFPWAISTGFSTVCLLIIWYQVYWYGNGASIEGNQFKKYSRGIVDTVIFCLPRRKPGQTDYYDELEEARKVLLDENGNPLPRVKSTIRKSTSMAHNSPTTPASDDLSKVSGISLYKDEGSDDENEELDQYEVRQEDIDAYVNSNIGNPMFNMSFDAELNNPVMKAMNQSFSKTASFVRSLSNLRSRNNSSLGRTQSNARRIPEDQL